MKVPLNYEAHKNMYKDGQTGARLTLYPPNLNRCGDKNVMQDVKHIFRLFWKPKIDELIVQWLSNALNF